MRICLLTTQDLDADPFPDNDWPCDPRPFMPEHDWYVATLLDKASGPVETERLIGEDFDLYFNLCDGSMDQDDVPGIEVVHMLEKHGVPFAGASSIFYDPTRNEMKAAAKKLGIATPRSVTAKTLADVKRAAKTLHFPLFVKHHNSYASIDISRHSRVQTPAGLSRQAKKIMSRHGAALIEEFIAGTECTVLVSETPGDPTHPTIYTPIQYRFPEGDSFKHSDLKWENYEGLIGSPIEDPILDARLRDETARFFVELGGTSFGRCDYRVTADGTPYLLEINANCGIYYPPADASGADVCLMHDPAGHEGFTRQLVAAALAK